MAVYLEGVHDLVSKAFQVNAENLKVPSATTHTHTHEKKKEGLPDSTEQTGVTSTDAFISLDRAALDRAAFHGRERKGSTR